ncbi:MAG: helix-turn-helix domain-containing protein [Candidatus Hydrothermarchaeales archaeon]
MLSKVEDELELLERHVKVLQLVLKNEPIGIIKLSELSGIPQHKIRYSLRMLEQNGIIKPSPQGAVTTRKATKFIEALPKRLEELIDKVGKTKKLVGV